jgi:hypothetical protein
MGEELRCLSCRTLVLLAVLQLARVTAIHDFDDVHTKPPYPFDFKDASSGLASWPRVRDAVQSLSANGSIGLVAQALAARASALDRTACARLRAGWSTSPLQQPLRTMEVPPEAQLALERVACVLARHTSRTPMPAAPRLSCIEQGRLFGYELALALQALRAVSMAGCGAVEAPMFVRWSPQYYGLKNTPGTQLQFLMKARRIVASLRSVTRRPVRCLRLHTKTNYVGEVFHEVLFGLSVHHTCADEVDAACAIVLGRTSASAVELSVPHPLVERNASMLAQLIPPPQLVTIRHAGGQRSALPALGSLEELGAEDQAFLREQYQLMRTLVPLDAPRFAPAGTLNVVLHTRAGRGARGYAGHALIPLVNAVRGALARAGMQNRLHVFHESAESTAKCCDMFAETAVGSDVVIHMDTNRMSAFHAFMMADVLLTADSVISSIAAALSYKARVAFDMRVRGVVRYDDSDKLAGGRVKHVFGWHPCNDLTIRTKGEKLCTGAATVGVADMALAERALAGPW